MITIHGKKYNDWRSYFYSIHMVDLLQEFADRCVCSYKRGTISRNYQRNSTCEPRVVVTDNPESSRECELALMFRLPREEYVELVHAVWDLDESESAREAVFAVIGRLKEQYSKNKP